TRRWEDLSQKMTFRIVYRAGGTREDQIEVYERRSDGERKTIAFVVAPAEVKGTGFLAFARAGRAPEQWLYLPDLKRVRQTASHTAVEITDLKFNQGLKDDLFTQRQLERGGR